MNSGPLQALFNTVKKLPVAVAVIFILCFTLLSVYQHLFRLSSEPLSPQKLFSVEIDGCLNDVENRNGKNYFKVRECANQYFCAKLTPLAGNANVEFYKNAVIGDFIHKAGDSDTLVLIKSSNRYYYLMSN